MAEQDKVGRTIVAILGAAAIAYAAYKLMKGDTVKEAITAPIKKVAEIAGDTTKTVKRLIKGSPEAKAHMKKLSSMRKKKQPGDKKKKYKKKSYKSLRYKNEQHKDDMREKILGNNIATKKDRDKEAKKLYGKKFKDISLHECELVNSNLLSKGYILSADEPTKKEIDAELKIMRASKGGKATAKLGKHKGHATKRGLSQDQLRISREEWEKTYRKDHSRKK